MITSFFIKTALAAGLVPCEGVNCDQADFYELIVRVINFAIQKLAFPLVVLFFLIGGFILLTSGGSPTRVEQGKKAITGAIVGLVIVLTSVVVINTLIVTFTKCEFPENKGKIAVGLISCPGIESKSVETTTSDGVPWWKKAIQSGSQNTGSPNSGSTGGGPDAGSNAGSQGGSNSPGSSSPTPPPGRTNPIPGGPTPFE